MTFRDKPRWQRALSTSEERFIGRGFWHSLFGLDMRVRVMRTGISIDFCHLTATALLGWLRIATLLKSMSGGRRLFCCILDGTVIGRNMARHR